MNEAEFRNKYNLIDNHNILLSQMTKKLRQKRPKVPSELTYTLFEAGNFAQIWLQTKGCGFSKTGSCSCCDYWEGEKVDNIAEVFQVALAGLSPNITSILIETSGSVLDENEISMQELKSIMELLNERKLKKIVIETHMSTITNEKLHLIRESITSAEVCIEVGVESLSREVLYYSLNKMTVLKEISQLSEMIHAVDFKLITNVMLGAPFLTLKNQIEDAVNSIRNLFDKGVDYVILFPVNIKQYTLVYWLYQNEMYTRVYGQTVIKVLNQIDKKLLDRVDVVWYGNRKQANPAYELDIIGPYYCEECSDKMMNFFECFNMEENLNKRKELLFNINCLMCDCKNFLEQILHDGNLHKPNMYDQMDHYYEHIVSFLS